MKKKKVSIILFIIAGLILSSCHRRTEQNVNSGDNSHEKTVTVSAIHPQKAILERTLILVGTVESLAAVHIVAKVPGTIVAIPDKIDESVFVKKGEMMAQIDDTEIRLNLKKAEANLSFLNWNYQRSRELFVQKVIAEREWQQLQAERNVAQAEVDLLRQQLDDTRVKAEIAGTITAKFVEQGDTIAAGTKLFSLTDLDNLRISAPVHEKDVSRLSPGQKAIITVDAYPEETFPGQLNIIGSRLDLATRTLPVKIGVTDSQNKLLPGMFARVQLITKVIPEAIAIPQITLHESKGEYWVFIIKEGRAHKVPVQIGLSTKDLVEIREGLDSDNYSEVEIISSGTQFLQDGMKVEVK